MNNLLKYCVGFGALVLATAASAQSGNLGGSGNAIGGDNVDNLAFAVVGNVITVTVGSVTGGSSVQLSVPIGGGASPQAVAQAILARLSSMGGAASGPLALAILEGVTAILRGGPQTR